MGRLDQLSAGDRVWVWFSVDRKQQPTGILMLADEISEQDIHGPGVKVKDFVTPIKPEKGAPPATITLQPVKGPSRVLTLPSPGAVIEKALYVQSAGNRARVLMTPEEFEKGRDQQKAWLRKVWTKEGLPGTVALGFAYATCSAMARPSLMAALANVPEEVRGTVLGLNVTAASLGWLGAASLGGWIMVGIGFAGFGPFALAVALVAAVLALGGRRTA